MTEIGSDSPDKSPESGWGDEPCWGCGSKGDHPTLGGHYWPCGTMKCASIRGEQCYETEITRLKGLVRDAHDFMEILLADNFTAPIRTMTQEWLDRPEVKAIRRSDE